MYSGSYYDQGAREHDNGNYEEAIRLYTLGIKISPRDPQLYRNRGAAHCVLKNFSTAVRDCTEAITMNPRDYRAYYWRAKTQLNLKNYRAAIDDATESISSNYYNNRVCDPYWIRIKAYEALKNYSELRENIDEILSHEPNNSEALSLREKIVKKAGGPLIGSSSGWQAKPSWSSWRVLEAIHFSHNFGWMPRFARSVNRLHLIGYLNI